MPADVSSLVYPRLNAYLAQLPAGLMSFADHQARTDLILTLREEYPQVLGIHDLPPSILRVLKQPLVRGEWIPETYLQVCHLIVRDRFLSSDEEFLQHVRTRMRKLLRHPILKPLMLIWSPKLMIMGVRARYNLFHKGGTWELKGGDSNRHHAELRFPPNLLHHLFLRDIAVACEEGVSLTGAKDIKCDVSLVEAGLAKFTMTWSDH